VHTGFWWRNLKVRGHLEGLALEGRVILKRIFMNWFGGAWTGLMWLRIRASGGLMGKRYETLSYVKCRECLEARRKKYYAPWG